MKVRVYLLFKHYSAEVEKFKNSNKVEECKNSAKKSLKKMSFVQTRLKVAEAQYTSADIIYTGRTVDTWGCGRHTQRC